MDKVFRIIQNDQRRSKCNIYHVFARQVTNNPCSCVTRFDWRQNYQNNLQIRIRNKTLMYNNCAVSFRFSTDFQCFSVWSKSFVIYFIWNWHLVKLLCWRFTLIRKTIFRGLWWNQVFRKVVFLCLLFIIFQCLYFLDM